MSRKLFIAGNWKMHFTPKEAARFANTLRQELAKVSGVELMVAPSFIDLPFVAAALEGSNISVGAQNVYFQDEGAFTGEVSAPMLKGLAKYVVVGHSERRHVFGETDAVIAQKVAAVVRNRLKIVLCVGETLVERQHKNTAKVLHDQLTANIRHLTDVEIAKLTIAYEPVWAIGTGQIAKPEQVQEAAALIRGNVSSLYGEATAAKVRILYGGSVTAATAAGFLHIEGIDGLFVGGASLNAKAFGGIVAAAKEISNKE